MIRRLDNDPKGNDFFDAKFKAIAIGGSYYLFRKSDAILQRNKIEVPFRLQLLKESIKEASSSMKWTSLNKWLVRYMTCAFINFLTIDNAYNQLVENAIKKYNEKLKKEGLDGGHANN